MAVEIELRVKSGPGDIIGINKVSTIDNVADLSGIQFNEPGEYIISVISNSNEIENTEFTINILPEEEVIPQDEGEEKPDQEPITGNRPIISQIDEPSLKLDPIEFSSVDNIDDNSEVANSLGYTPLFSYNNTPIESRYISKLEIYYEDFIPKVEIIFKDALGIVNSPKSSPLNDTKFDVFLNSGSDVLKSIHLKFKLEINQRNKSGTNTITGILDIPDFYKINYKSYKGTSFEALRKLCKDLQLGFNSNIDNTNDSMVWRRNGISTMEFMKNILDHSYISDDSFIIGYIDYYWSFNYVDIEKEWKRDISNDVGLISQGVSSMSKEDESDRVVRMILSNDLSGQTTPFYITNVIINNNSTYQSSKKGNYTVSKVYDRNKKQFLKFNVDSLNSDTRDQVILKGAPGDKDEYETNYRTSYGGKIDTSNVHQNYAYAVDQNKRNLQNLSNITLEADLPNPNYNLYKFQKITIAYINQKQTITDPSILDERISGEWIIIDIRFIWKNGGLKQSIVCTRKELGKTTDEKQNQVIEGDNTVDNSEINENPTDNIEETGEIQEESIEEDVFNFGDEDDLSDLLLEDEFRETEFMGEEELAIEIEKRNIQQEEASYNLGNPDEDSTTKISDNTDPESFTGPNWKSFSINKAIEEINKTSHGVSSNFQSSLFKTLMYIKNDNQIKDIREASYLLGTAYAESSYSLERWEADYTCGPIGKKYGSSGPCDSALNYFRKEIVKNGRRTKINYYELGTDRNGLPYFGRGLIQLTGKENYRKYGSKIGVDLLNNGDLALDPQNSYKISVNFMIAARTFTYVKEDNLTRARRSINGGTNGISEVNSAYRDWVSIFQRLDTSSVS